MIQILDFALLAGKAEAHFSAIFQSTYKCAMNNREFNGNTLDLIYNIKSEIPEYYRDCISRPAIIYTGQTRSSQQSMTLNALVKLNMLSVTRSEITNKKAYKLNLDNEITQRCVEFFGL